VPVRRRGPAQVDRVWPQNDLSRRWLVRIDADLSPVCPVAFLGSVDI
jgi:hypothetical protein